MVDLGSLRVVTFFEELSRDSLQSKEDRKLLCYWVLVEVRSVFSTEERNRELHRVSICKSFILVQEVASEVRVELVFNAGSRQRYNHVLFHRLKGFLE